MAIAAATIAIVTGAAALADALDPALGPGGHPHPTLHGTLHEALSIFVTNARLLIVALLLVAGRWPTGRLTRHVGDLIVGALLVVNPATIGLALGRFQATLLPYLPHLPLEDAALATAAAAWLSRRLPQSPGHAGPQPGRLHAVDAPADHRGRAHRDVPGAPCELTRPATPAHRAGAERCSPPRPHGSPTGWPSAR